jgi:hypothetical protein
MTQEVRSRKRLDWREYRSCYKFRCHLDCDGVLLSLAKVSRLFCCLSRLGIVFGSGKLEPRERVTTLEELLRASFPYLSSILHERHVLH